MYFRSVVWLLFCFTLFSCSTSRLIPKTHARIDTLGVCVTYGPLLPEEMRMMFENQLEAYIVSFNSQPHAFRLQHCANPDVESIRLHVMATRFVSKGQQITGAVVSTIGLALPVVMVASGVSFFVGFFYFPKEFQR